MPLTIAQTMNLPNASLADGQNPILLAGKAGEGIVAELHGKYYTQCYRGNVFVGSTAAAGVVPPVTGGTTGTGHTYAIWNPAQSGKLIVPIKVQVGMVTVGTVTDCLGWDYATGLGASVASGSSISAFTTAAPVNMNTGSTNKSIAKFGPSGSTITVVSGTTSWLRAIGVSNFTAGSPTAVNNFWQLTEYYDGDFIVPPGTAIFFVSNIAGVATWAVSTTWEEVPV